MDTPKWLTYDGKSEKPMKMNDLGRPPILANLHFYSGKSNENASCVGSSPFTFHPRNPPRTAISRLLKRRRPMWILRDLRRKECMGCLRSWRLWVITRGVLHEYIYIYTDLFIYICMYMYVCIYICIRITRAHTYIQTYIHILVIMIIMVLIIIVIVVHTTHVWIWICIF